MSQKFSKVVTFHKIWKDIKVAVTDLPLVLHHMSTLMFLPLSIIFFLFIAIFVFLFFSRYYNCICFLVWHSTLTFVKGVYIVWILVCVWEVSLFDGNLFTREGLLYSDGTQTSHRWLLIMMDPLDALGTWRYDLTELHTIQLYVQS